MGRSWCGIPLQHPGRSGILFGLEIKMCGRLAGDGDYTTWNSAGDSHHDGCHAKIILQFTLHPDNFFDAGAFPWRCTIDGENVAVADYWEVEYRRRTIDSAA